MKTSPIYSFCLLASACLFFFPKNSEAQRLSARDLIWSYQSGTSNQLKQQVEFDSLGHVFLFYEESSVMHCTRLNKHTGDTLNTYQMTADSTIDVHDLHLDRLGNAYVTGSQATANASNHEVVTAKFDSLGNKLWSNTYNGSASIYDVGEAIDVDANGNVYVVGTINQLANGTHLNSAVVTIKYNSNGTQSWANVYQGTMPPSNVFGWANRQNDRGRDIAVNSAGEVFIVGSTDDYLAVDSMPDPFGSGNIPHFVEAQKGFFIKYSNNGVLQWNKKSATHGLTFWPNFSSVYYNNDVYYKIEVKNNYLYLGQEFYQGYLSSSTSWSNRIPYTYSNAIAKYNFSGTKIFSDFLVTNNNDREKVQQVLITDQDEYYVLAKSDNSANNFDWFKYNATNSLQYSKSYSGFGMEASFDVFGNTAYMVTTEYIFVAGQTSTNIRRIDPVNGTTIWNKTSGNSANTIFAARTDETGDLYNSMLRYGYQLIKFCKEFPNVNISTADTSICPGDSLQLQASTNAFQFNWTSAASLSDSTLLNPIASPQFSRGFVLRGELENGCYSLDTVRIDLSTTYQEINLCNGDSVVVGNSVYYASGTYLDTLNSSGQCDSIVTTLVRSAIASSQRDTMSICANDSIFFHGTYLSQAGVYADTLQNRAGCDSILVLDLRLNSGSQQSLTAQACGQYYWSQTNTVYVFSGTYHDTLTSVSGCDSVLTLNLTVNPRPNANAGIDQSICNAGSVQIGGTPTTTTPSSTFQWDNAATLNNATIANPTASPLVNTVYTVTVTNLNGCTATDQVLVIVNPIPNADAGPDLSICSGSSVSIGGSPTSTTAGVTYLWNNSSTLSNPSVQNPIASPTVTTIYTVTVTHPNGCTNTDQMFVNVNPLPTANAGSDFTMCFGDTMFIGGTPTGPAGATFAWDNGASLADGTKANPMAFPTVTTNYTVTVTDVNGCTSTDQIRVSVSSPAQTNITASSCGAYTWFQTNQTYQSSGTYYDTITTALGCDSIISLSLSVTNINIGVTQNGSTFTVNQSGGSYQWFDCNSAAIVPGATSQSFTPSINGTYGVEVIFSSCVDSSACIPMIISGIDEQIKEPTWIAYPNPTSNYLFLEQTDKSQLGDQLQVFDQLGRRVMLEIWDDNPLQLNLSSLSPGLYFINYKKVSKKIVVR